MLLHVVCTHANRGGGPWRTCLTPAIVWTWPGSVECSLAWSSSASALILSIHSCGAGGERAAGGGRGSAGSCSSPPMVESICGRRQEHGHAGCRARRVRPHARGKALQRGLECRYFLPGSARVWGTAGGREGGREGGRAHVMGNGYALRREGGKDMMSHRVGVPLSVENPHLTATAQVLRHSVVPVTVT
eukprot:359081-Chlamydomonas_euryale.AAC.3